MALEPGIIDGAGNFLNPDCMAKFIENEMPPPFDDKDSGKKGRREFLIAISTGIIKYLKAHDGDGFRVHVSDEAADLTGSLEIIA